MKPVGSSLRIGSRICGDRAITVRRIADKSGDFNHQASSELNTKAVISRVEPPVASMTLFVLKR